MSESSQLISMTVNQYTKEQIEYCELTAENKRLRAALERIRDCDWVITLPDRMDAVRAIAREALE